MAFFQQSAKVISFPLGSIEVSSNALMAAFTVRVAEASPSCTGIDGVMTEYKTMPVQWLAKPWMHMWSLTKSAVDST
eukprot:1491129-Amphidinium_carterae.1